MTRTCPLCNRIATEVSATDAQCSYRGGCEHLQMSRVDGAVVVVFGVIESSRGPQSWSEIAVTAEVKENERPNEVPR